MRRLLLLTNCLWLCVLFAFCQARTKNGAKNKIDTTLTIFEADSIAKANAAILGDTLGRKSSLHSEIKSTNADSSNSLGHQTKQTNATEVHRIEHGSDNQVILDSIKNAKAKTKK
jgi:hypothetical protein